MHTTDRRKARIAVEGDGLVVKSQQRRYTLDELLARCNPKARRARQEREWLDSQPVGDEFI